MRESEGHDVELAETFADVARALIEEADVDATLSRICELAVKTIDGCETAGVSIIERGEINSRSTTDDLPRVIDEIQSETQQGPCVDAIREHQVFITGRLSDEARWPDFATRANEETGVESILALRLFTQAETMGALNLYSRQSDAFDDQDIAVGSVFAAHAAIALLGATHDANLENKAASRDLIGMAKGIIMARQTVSEDEAFDVLRRASQRLNIKLRDLADLLVHPRPVETPLPAPD